MSDRQPSEKPATPPRTTAVTETSVEAEHDGRVVAAADITSPGRSPGTTDVVFHTSHNGAPATVRHGLVDSVLADPGVRSSEHLHAVVPLGDGASLSRLQDRTRDMSARAAGSSSIVDADLEAPTES